MTDTHAPQQTVFLFDHLVGAAEQQKREGDAKVNRPRMPGTDMLVSRYQLLQFLIQLLLPPIGARPKSTGASGQERSGVELPRERTGVR